MPVAQIALTSGFRSLRRFNAAFVDGYRMNPTRLRRAAPRAGTREDRHRDCARRGQRRQRRGDHRDASATGRRSTARACWRSSPSAPSRASRARATTPSAAPFAPASPGPRPARLEVRFAPTQARVQLSFAPLLGPASGTVIALARRWLDLDAAPETIAETPRRSTWHERPAPAGQHRRVLFRRACRPRPAGHGGGGPDAGAPPRRALRRHGRDAVDRRPPPVSGAERSCARRDRAHRRSLGIIRSRAGAIQALAAQWDDLVPLLRAGRSRLRRWSSACACRRASAPGPRTTSRCERSAGSMPFRPATSPRSRRCASCSPSISARAAEAHAGSVATVARLCPASSLEFIGSHAMTYATTSILQRCTAKRRIASPFQHAAARAQRDRPRRRLVRAAEAPSGRDRRARARR